MIHEFFITAHLKLIVTNKETGEDEINIVREANQYVELLEPTIRWVDHIALAKLLSARFVFLVARVVAWYVAVFLVIQFVLIAIFALILVLFLVVVDVARVLLVG